MQQVKGAVLKTRLAFVEERGGKAAVQQVIAALPPDDQRALKIVFTSNWYPFELSKRLDDAIVTVLGAGDPAWFERLGAASAERNLGGVHAGYLTKGDPHAFLAKAGQIYAAYYESGSRSYERTGDRRGTLVTRDAETFSAPDCLTVTGWYRRALEMCGAGDVRVAHPECRAKGGAVCRYEVSWASP